MNSGWVHDLVAQYGYLIVFVAVAIESLGVPVPGETALVVAGAFASKGTLNPWLVGGIAVVGAVIGDNIGYWIGRRWGRKLTQVRGIRRIYDPARLAVADRFFEKHGFLAVMLGRFVALLRIFAGPLAGMHHMPWGRFLVANALGAVIWVSVVVSIAYAIGEKALTAIERAGYFGLAALVAIACVLFVIHHRRAKRERERGAELLREPAATED